MAPEETHARAALEAEREVLRTQLDEYQGVAHDDNFADSGQVAAEQGENRAMISQLEETLADVERALAKLDDGVYGRCERCGNAIGEPRLEAMPAARYCINCAS